VLKNIIIDADTGIDDAIAIVFALGYKKVKVKLITTVYGSSTVENTTQNTLNILSLVKRGDVPVAKGEDKPFLSEWNNDVFAHGKNGLGDYQFRKNSLKIIKDNAVEAMYKALKGSKKKISIIALGALTNVAKLLYNHPDVRKKISSIVISGGLLKDNKKKPYIGFNVAQDSYAVEYIFNSKVKTIICPSDLGHQAFLDLEEQEQLAKINKTGKVFKEIFKNYTDRHVGKGSAATHDACAVACIVEPKLFKFESRYVYLRKVRGAGKSIIDFDAKLKKKHIKAKVATKIKAGEFKNRLFEVFKKMP